MEHSNHIKIDLGYSYSDFKGGIVAVRDRFKRPALEGGEHEDSEVFDEGQVEVQDLSQAGSSKSDERMMEEKFAVMLLKLENVLHVASSAVDEKYATLSVLQKRNTNFVQCTAQSLCTILSNLSQDQHSSLSPIYTILCKSSYVKEYG